MNEAPVFGGKKTFNPVAKPVINNQLRHIQSSQPFLFWKSDEPESFTGTVRTNNEGDIMKKSSPNKLSAAKQPKQQKKHQAKPRQRDPDAELLAAAEAGDLDSAKIAIADGAQAHITGDCLLMTNTVVTHAAASGNAELVEFLLRSGAECPDFYTEGPDIAVDSGNVRMVCAFLKYWRFESHVYLGWLDSAVEAGHDQIYKLLLRHCEAGDKKDRILANKKELNQERRAEAARAKATEEMKVAPSSPARKWLVQTDGIYLEGPWDPILGPQLRELNAKWLRPGWCVSLKHAGALAELLSNYPRLEAERQEQFRPARESLADIPVPAGYRVHYRDWQLEVSGRGNADLDAQLNKLFGCGRGFENKPKVWGVRSGKLRNWRTLFANIQRRHHHRSHHQSPNPRRRKP